MAASCASVASCSSLLISGCGQRSDKTSRECSWGPKASSARNIQCLANERVLDRCSRARSGRAALRLAGADSKFQSLSQSSVKRHRGEVRASADSENETQSEKPPFGYTRKDVLVLGVGVIVAGFALKYGLEAAGVDSLVAGNVIQITFVLGLTVLWVFSYVFRVANKEMTYVKQLKNYEEEVMKKRLEELPEAELENMLAAVEEEKRRLEERRKTKQQQ